MEAYNKNICYEFAESSLALSYIVERFIRLPNKKVLVSSQ
jgi:hypothetical protein